MMIILPPFNLSHNSLTFGTSSEQSRWCFLRVGVFSCARRYRESASLLQKTETSIVSMSLEGYKSSRRRCDCYDLFDEQVPYLEAWRWQKSMVEARVSGIQNGIDLDDALVLLQHPPVYTMGTRSSEKFLRFHENSPPFDLYRIERGGEVTYHGPGQLVMYPILNLRRHKTDVHWYLRSLEEVIIRALWTACALEASRIEGLTGVWVGDHKVAAIGVRVSRWITYHGLALNVTTDLTPFENIIPCGISDRTVGSVIELVNAQGGEQSSMQTFQANKLYQQSTREGELSEMVTRNANSHFLLDLLHRSLLQSFAEVFDLHLIPARKGVLNTNFEQFKLSSGEKVFRKLQ